MNKQLLKDGVLWGFALWFFGWVLGIVFFFIVPPSMIGFFVMPLGVLVTLLVLFKRIKSVSFKHYFLIALIWTLIAIIFDYLFIVKMMKPSGGYYKFDVYVYYFLTFLLPLLVGLKKSKKI